MRIWKIMSWLLSDTAQKMKFSIKDFFSKCDQIRCFLRIWSDLLKKFLMENFIFCVVWNMRLINNFLAGIYLVKINNRNTRTRYEICSKLTMKTPEWCHWRRSGVFIVNFEHVLRLVLMFLLLTLNM